MANIKITDLNAYTDPDSTDVLPIVDVTSDETKKVSIADLLENAGSGTAAAPGIAFDGDSNTGIYRPGADQIAISTGGTKRLEISATGAVTIPGNLTVEGTTTFIDSTTLRVEDKNIELGYVDTPTDTTADGGGITLKGATDKTINWVNSTDAWTSSERFDFPAGTAAAPSVILNGDVNSGLYQPGADQVAISTGGTGRLFIDSSGRLGVGTSSPEEKLEVIGNVYLRSSETASVGKTARLYGGAYADNPMTMVYSNNDASNNRLYLGGGTGGGEPASQIQFYTGSVGTKAAGTARMTINSSGNLGVGTSSPSRALHVATSASSVVGQLECTNQTFASFDITNTGGYARVTSLSNNLLFSPGGTERLRIDSSGNVGIGNTSPDDYLTIANTSTSGDIGLRFKGNASSRQFIMFGDPGGAQLGDIMYDHGTNAMRFRVNNAERARIDSSGRLGVGTSSPSAKLDVQGGAIFDDYDSGATPSTSGISVTGGFIGISRANTAGTAIRVRNNTGDALLLNTNGSAYFANNVGIGTASPGAKLQIDSASAFTALKLNNTAGGTAVDLGATSTGDLAIRTGTTEAARIDSSRRLGVGISSPAARLDVSSTSGTLFRCENPSVAQLNIGNGGNSINYYDADAQIFRNGSGTERVRITQAGRLGVGTSTPQAELHLHDTTGLSRLRFTGGAAGADNFEIGQAIVGVSNSGFSIYDVDEAATRLAIDSSGRLLVGTTSASTADKLIVQANASSSTGAAVLGLQVGTTTVSAGVDLGYLNYCDSSGNRGAWILGEGDGTWTSGSSHPGRLVFSTTASGASSPTERMRISSSGVLTAGSNNATGGQTIIDGWYSGDNRLNVLGSHHSSGNTVLAFAVRPKEGGSGYVSSAGNAAFGKTALELGGAGFAFKTGASSTVAIGTDVTLTERMRLDSSGRLGVGTSSPSEKLHVAGKLLLNNGSASYFDAASSGGLNITNPSAVRFEVNSSERVRITNEGRVGIGVSSPSYMLDVVKDSAGGTTALRVKNGNTAANSDAKLYLDTANGSWELTALRSGGRLSFGLSGSEKAAIDGSGRLLVGTTTASGPPRVDIVGNSSSSTGSGVLQLRRGSNASSDGTELGYLAFGDTISGGYQRALVAAYADGAGGTGDLPTRLSFWTTPDGSATPGERMRIASTGETELYTNTSFNLRTNRTSGLTAALNVYKGATSISSGTLCCQIRADGDLLNTNNSYGALSDVKLKENIVDANSQWDDLKAIQVRNYNFKEGQTHTQLGVVAQEVELVSPGLVRDTPDTDEDGNDLGTTTKSVNYSVLYMKAVKALQEAMERIETLEAKVAALEGN